MRRKDKAAGAEAANNVSVEEEGSFGGVNDEVVEKEYKEEMKEIEYCFSEVLRKRKEGRKKGRKGKKEKE